MPFVPYTITGPAFLELSFETLVNGQQCISLFHYLYSSNVVIEDGRAAAVSFLEAIKEPDNLYDAYRACLAEDAGEVNAYAQWIHPTRFPYITMPEPGPATGPEGMAPQNVSAAITKRGQIAGRKGIGTLHMPAVPTAWLLNGQVVQPIGDPYQVLADQLTLEVTIGDPSLEPVLFNRDTPLDSQLIADAFLQVNSRVQRRRTVGLGA